LNFDPRQMSNSSNSDLLENKIRFTFLNRRNFGQSSNVWAFALTFIAHLAERTHLAAPSPYYKASLFCVRGVRVQTSTDDQIAIVKLIKCLDHKKAKEIKSKSLGRKLQSFLSSHAQLAHTHTQSQSRRARETTQTHADMHR